MKKRDDGSYDACALSYDEYGLLPMTREEIQLLRNKLDGMNTAEADSLVDETFIRMKNFERNSVMFFMSDLHSLYGWLEQALYVANTPEERQTLCLSLPSLDFTAFVGIHLLTDPNLTPI